MKVLFRTDSSKQIGTGHVMRCLNLAQKFRSYGHEVKFVCRNLDCNISDTIISYGFKVFLLKKDQLNHKTCNELFHSKWLETSWENDAQQTINVLGEYQADWVVVDHYAIDYKWENIVKNKSNTKIFVIDDLVDRKHNCEAMLDQNFLLDQDVQYKDLIPRHCKKFLGPEYALIKEDFWIEHKANFVNNTAFIFFGGIDLPGATLKALQALINIDFNGEANVVCGSYNPRIKEITEVCRINKNFQLFIDTDSVAKIISSSSFGIAAGGTNTWERCVLALPTLIFSIAPNQEKISKDCEKANLCSYAGRIEELNHDVLKCFIANKKQHQSIAVSCLIKFKNSKIDDLLKELKFITKY
ncbi:MAG: UDP-2,4-diacetamido-2,4,6-trideoxy-beta-L-altropyranose hydrolase [Rickettsiaceae bacterium]